MTAATAVFAWARAAVTGSHATSDATHDVDWPAWLALAELHQLVPMLAGHVADRVADHVPAHIREHLHARASAVAYYNLFFMGELQRVLQLLDDAGIAAVTYKGPVLAQQAYGSLRAREFVDADVLVRADRVAEACTILRAHGYELQHPMGRNAQRLYLRTYRQLPLQSADGMMVVELHSALTPAYLPLGRQDNALFERSIVCDVGGVALRTLSSEDHLLLLCMHATKERWPHLRAVVDIAGYIRNQQIDWRVVSTRAAEWRVSGALALALELAGWLTDVGVTHPDVSAHAQRDAVAAAAARVKARLLSDAPAPGVREELDVVYHTLDTARDRMRFALHHVAGHSLKDWDSWPGGDHGLGLTRVTRPCRLAFVYTTAAARRLLGNRQAV